MPTDHPERAAEDRALEAANIEAYFDSLPTHSTIVGFNNERAFGVVISFIEKGLGFGEITFSMNKATGVVTFDNEGMNTETCGRIIERLARTTEGEP